MWGDGEGEQEVLKLLGPCKSESGHMVSLGLGAGHKSSAEALSPHLGPEGEVLEGKDSTLRA